MSIKVLLADDHAIVRDGLKMLLEHSGIEVVEEVDNGRQALKTAAKLQPDVAVLDITMPELNGIETASLMREKSPDTKVVILSMHATEEYIFMALEAGVMGYVLKESAGREVVDAVRAAYSGNYYLSKKIGDAVMSRFLSGAGETPVSPLQSLSHREREVLQLVVEGRTSAEIAKKIFLSPKTVETYRSRLMKKLGVRGITELVAFAVEHGIIPGAGDG
jgi:DNA-binding NarL/FixJ family response regulator